MTFESICENVKLAIQDTEWGSENPDELKWKVNQAYQETAEDTCITIPQLKAAAVLTTSTTLAYISAPVDFSKQLMIAPSDGTAEDLQVLDGGLEEMMKSFPSLDDTGDVRYVAFEGSTIWYQGIPSVAKTLVLLYMKTVTPLVNASDTPSIIPDHLHYGLLVNKAAELCWREIEDGLEGDKINTMRFRAYYQEALTQFNTYLLKRRSNVSRSIWDA
jgi:hypothetical protein